MSSKAKGKKNLTDTGWVEGDMSKGSVALHLFTIELMSMREGEGGGVRRKVCFRGLLIEFPPDCREFPREAETVQGIERGTSR